MISKTFLIIDHRVSQINTDTILIRGNNTMIVLTTDAYWCIPLHGLTD